METKKVQELDICKRYHFNFEEENHFAVVNGVIINSAIIDRLSYIQKDEPGDSDSNKYFNEGYKDYAKDLAELFAYLSYSAQYTEENEKVIELSQSLDYILKAFKELSFPGKILSSIEIERI